MMKILAIAILVALAIFLVLYVTLIGRRRLAQRTTTVVPVPPPVPEALADGVGPGPGADGGPDGGAGGPGSPVRFGPLEAVYVSTTLHGDWLARVGAHGLGDRSRALVSVLDQAPAPGNNPAYNSAHDAGVLIERDGADDLWIPVSTIRSAGLAPGMAGKYVGADGLVVLTWAVPEADGVAPALVDTGLRTRRAEDRGGLVDAVRYLLAAEQSRQPQPYPQDSYRGPGYQEPQYQEPEYEQDQYQQPQYQHDPHQQQGPYQQGPYQQEAR